MYLIFINIHGSGKFPLYTALAGKTLSTSTICLRFLRFDEPSEKRQPIDNQMVEVISKTKVSS